MSTVPKSLFIGGSADGQRMAVPESCSQYCLVETMRPNPPSFSIDPTIPTIVRESYNAHMIQGEHLRFRVFICEGMPIDVALEHLIAHYRPCPS